jgi:hypothetical protein
LIGLFGRLETLIYETIESVTILGLVLSLGVENRFVWPDSFCSQVSRVASSARAYLLAMANISSGVLGFFIESLWIKDESMCPFLKNMIIDLLSTFRMMFLCYKITG